MKTKRKTVNKCSKFFEQLLSTPEMSHGVDRANLLERTRAGGPLAWSGNP